MSVRIITFNCNGVRSSAKKGLYDWISQQNADFVCLQEIKAQPGQLLDSVYHPDGFECYLHAGERKGYSGTAIYSRVTADNCQKGYDEEVSYSEGRYLRLDIANLTIICLYLPSGRSSEDRQAIKMSSLQSLYGELQALKQTGRQLVVCGDWNMCHRRDDLKNWQANQRKPGFLEEERAWLDRLTAELGMVDAFRDLTQGAGHYTWWSQRSRAKETNAGWRLDYHMINPGLRHRIKRVTIYRELNFSDHVPVLLELDGDLDELSHQSGW